ncbi:aminotransferase class I/II-fold pyridoxal phosphate-dependent enzyme [Paenibacillus sp. SGZ-1009]|uniref:aminotransferase class I/II-fold pyridoxal phosphate-dependent enzyme n=1 Tax=Paenibacillus campi TaxID=3106031 RepID=UPI002AFEC26C|nr:aminotransferase class I/II-fold pyridoxal phosphate-dependent enzyme [Paenibacillus sp. SGZ-1009]
MVVISPSIRVQQLPDQEFSVIINEVNHMVQQGIDIINVSQGNPDRPTPPHIVHSLQQAAADPLLHKYAPFRGYTFFKEAISAFYKRDYGVTIDPHEEIAIFNGGKAALYAVSQALLNQGDTVLLPNPGYPEYLSGLLMAQALPHYMKLSPDNGYLPDYTALDDKLLQQTKLMYLNYPSNPTGAIATRSFFDDTVRLAEQYNIGIVHDFAYAGLGLNGHKPLSFLSSPGAKQTGIEIYTLSKTYNMAGWRVAFAVGNRQMIQAINAFQDHVFVSLFGAIQQASASALLDDQHCVQQLAELYEQRTDYFIERCRTVLNWSIAKPGGTFYVWAPVPPGWDSFSFTKLLLDKAHIAVTPGAIFGTEARQYVRFSMIVDHERLQELIDRLAALKIDFAGAI